MITMPLDRLAWLITVVACCATSVVLLLSGYLGYAGVLLAVAVSAAINLPCHIQSVDQFARLLPAASR